MREWIVTNGLGGYASLTYHLTNTRKYHGLLIASHNPPTERWFYVTNILDRVEKNSKMINLIDHKPAFKFDIFPSFTYNHKDFKIKKTFFMEHGKNTTIIKYNVKPKNSSFNFVQQPVVNSRHIYDVTRNRYLEFNQRVFKNMITIKPNHSEKTLKILLKDINYDLVPYWDEYYYEKDRLRNDSWIDNNLRAGKIIRKIKKEVEFYLILTIEDIDHFKSGKIYYQKELERRRNIFNNSKLSKKYKKLVFSSDNFIVKKGTGTSVIAGYHWFGDWGRDTLIALPGLCLVTRRFNEAKKILHSFAKYCKNGLIPNVFSERDSTASYNNVDSSLWFIDRVFQYIRYTNDLDFLKEIWTTLNSIIEGYKDGTDFDIHMDQDYLISHGPGLTWMDVKIDNYYPTPRADKAVEIQALWYNALMIMSYLSRLIGKEDKYLQLSEKVKENFKNKYDQQYDVIDKKDTSFRPNQIFLVSLDFNMIDKNLQEKIVKEIQEKLMTPFGLRSLIPDHPDYKGHYIGDYNKDIAYHNGTVWSWLLGPFIKAYVKINNYQPKYRDHAYEKFLLPMLRVYGDRWDGNIYEIFDGDPVYAPHGCITQAWSVAEILRCWVEDIENNRPKYYDPYSIEKERLHKISI